MRASYPGIYRLGPREMPRFVQVIRCGAHYSSMRVVDYISRRIIRDRREFLSKRHYRVILGVSRHVKDKGRVIHVVDADECVDAGWLKTGGALRLLGFDGVW